jgi:Zn-dependent peptidase ImmA (M78 family)
MSTKETTYPYLKNSTIEKESMNLLSDFYQQSDEKLSAPVPVFDIIEYLGYDVDFRKDGIYKDKNLLGGTLIDKKTIEINENLSDHEGRMHFTAAHEVGHIVLHVPLYKQKNQKDVSEHKIISRKDSGFEGNKKNPEEWQADKFAAYLLMPSELIKKAFFKNYTKPVNVRKKRLLEIFFPKPAFVKGYAIAEEVIRDGKFDNVSKMAMLNRLIGMRLVKGLSYQKASPHN